MAEPRSKLSSLVSHFESLTDPRALKARKHLLTDVMAIAVCVRSCVVRMGQRRFIGGPSRGLTG
jgi:hypothetical protein